MMLKREATGSNPSPWRKWIRAGSAAVAAAVSAVTLAAGCLDRPVTKQDPATSNIYVAEIRQTAVDKIDLLFMIDNSISMADKQEILKEAVPILVRRLVTPICLDAQERPTGQSAGANGCPQGTQPEFSPIKDIHIAIVTSSLGAHGGQVCDTTRPMADPSENDKAYPIGLVRPALAADPNSSWNGTGFLAWDPDATNPARARNNPPGVTNQMTLATQFQNMVAATGEVGCGYEASLEAWYRFLIDPEPPANVTLALDDKGNPSATVRSAEVDQSLLNLRARFLRPDSLVAIIMLTDENDCSIIDEGQSWLVGLQTYAGQSFNMPRSTSACATNPNDPCCTSCAAPAPAGCPNPDPVCATATLSPGDDNLNLRCYDQKRRFGFDLLHAPQRYVDGLTQPLIRGVDGTPKQNPLFAGAQRDRSLVFLAGIVGVPWQDVATEASWPRGAPLEYLKYQDLKAAGRLDWIMGPALPTGGYGPPTDALMFETPVDRTTITGQNPAHPGVTLNPMHPAAAVNARLAPSGTGPSSNPINGKESSLADNSDLQFACIFPLATPRMNCANTQANCDCRPLDAAYNRPLCMGTTQTHAKAYPGTRHLQVLRGFGDITQNAIIASICPKVSERAQMNDPSYGYTPAVSAIIERLKEALRGKCLPRPLTACNCTLAPGESCEDEGEIPCQGEAVPGQVSCAVIEAKLPPEGQACPACVDNPMLIGRKDADDSIRPAVHRQLAEQEHCGKAGLPACDAFCLCEIKQFTGGELRTCQTSTTTPTDIYGYCYIDPLAVEDDQEAAAAARTIVANCPQTQQRLLRFAGTDVPTKGAIALIACLGANVQN